MGARFYAARGLEHTPRSCLHQATKRYFHAALLVYAGYKPKTHDIALLAKQTGALHESLAGALPREAPSVDESPPLGCVEERSYLPAGELGVRSPRVRILITFA